MHDSYVVEGERSRISVRPFDDFLDLLTRFARPTPSPMSCSGIREALGNCILQSDCVLRSNPPRTPQDCLKHHVDELPEECQLLRKSFFECKKGMVRSTPVHLPALVAALR